MDTQDATATSSTRTSVRTSTDVGGLDPGAVAHEQTPVDSDRGPGPAQVCAPREVPLGGPRAMTVRRTLPQKQRSLIGAWCFLDHFGPDPVAATGG